MASYTPSKTSQLSESQPILPESPARIALAIKILQTKPQSLSIREYFALLRSHTVSGGRALNNVSEQRHIEACEFWRKRSEAEAGRALELQARINELTEKFTALTETDKSGEPAKKKVKATGKRGDTGRIVKQVGGQGEGQKPQPQKQQDILRTSDMSVFGENFAPFSGSSIYCLVSSLRLLQFTREPNLVPKSITQTSQALSNFIQDFINGKPSTLIHSAHLTRGAATALTNERREVVSFSEAVENSCIKVLSALKPLADNLQEGDNVTGASNSEFIVAGIQAVIKTLVEILSSIYINTKALLSAAIYHTPTKSSGKSPIKDIRLELTTVLIRLLKGLNPAVDYQRNILEGTLYCLLEIIGGALSRTLTGPPTNNNVEAELLDALAVDETTWYLLRMVESILPVAGFQFGAGDRKLEGKSRERLRDVLIRGLFGSKSECEGVKGQGGRKRGSEEKGFWKSLEGSGLRGHGSTVESPFLRALWELFGLDVLAA